MHRFIEELSKFEHRRSGSGNDTKVAQILKETFESYGLTTKLDKFRVYGSLFTRIIISIILLLIIFFILKDYYFLSIILYVMILISIWGELNFTFNFFGPLFPSHNTYNVEALYYPNYNYYHNLNPDPDPNQKKHIVIIAHHDSPKTGRLYRIADWLAPKQANLPEPFNRMFFLPLLSAILLGVVIIFRPFPELYWIRLILTILCTLVLGILLLTLLDMQLSKNSPGANDNGSGILVLMELARRFSQKKSKAVNFTLLATGAEEIGLAGIKHYIRQHPDLDKNNTLFINFECLGGGILHWATGEHYLRKLNYPQKGINIIRNLEKNGVIPELPKAPLISPTDATALASNEFNVVTLIGLIDGIVPSNYHSIGDTFDKLDQSLLLKSSSIVEKIIHTYCDK